MKSRSLASLPLELLHRILSHCSIPDVLCTAKALNRPELIEVQVMVQIKIHMVIPTGPEKTSVMGQLDCGPEDASGEPPIPWSPYTSPCRAGQCSVG